MSKAFAAIGLTGGGVGDLDSIDGALLSAGDVAFVVDAVEKKLYQYTLNSSGTASGTVAIAPTANPGTKTWDLVGAYVKDSITLDDGTQLGYLQFATAVLELYNAKAASGEIKLYAKDGAGNKEVTIACTGGGAVTLYYDNSAKLATSNTGVSVTGALVVSGNASANSVTITKWVDRGDPAAADFSATDINEDGTWRDLDLSAIVPAGATAVSLTLSASDDSAGSYILFRKKGNSNAVAVVGVTTQVSGVGIYGQYIVSCDTNRVIQYISDAGGGDNVWATLSITITGWFVP